MVFFLYLIPKTLHFNLAKITDICSLIDLSTNLPRIQSLLRKRIKRGEGGEQAIEKNWIAKHHGKGLEGIEKEQGKEINVRLYTQLLTELACAFGDKRN